MFKFECSNSLSLDFYEMGAEDSTCIGTKQNKAARRGAE